MNKLFLFTLITVASVQVTFAQRADSLDVDGLHAYRLNDTVYYYPKPRPFSFVTKIPATYAVAAKNVFRKQNLKPFAIIAASTAVLLLSDQHIADKVHQASRYIGLDNTRKYGKSITVLGLDLYDPPKNLNTWIYSIGEGVPPLIIAGGLWGFGLAKKDNRAISTASQIVQATTAAGFTTQLIKRIAGRESPFRATRDGGTWRPFPKPSTYQKNVSMFDAFSSGHMGTMAATYVVITENYPEKKWIKPVGIGVMSLVGLAMINNDVHWASDYPLAMGVGYAFGKATVKLNRFIKGEPMFDRKKKRHKA